MWQARALVLLCLWMLGLFQEAGAQSVSANACCAVNLSGGDRGEAIAADDADLELGGSGLRLSRDSFAVGCLSLAHDSLLDERGAVEIDMDLEGSKWNRLTGFFFAGRPYAGQWSRRRRGFGWQCPKKQTGSNSSLFPAWDSW